MRSKKGQINQVFVYILSAFVIAFIGFVVVKFVVSFTGDAQTIAEQKFYDTIEDDYESVYRTYGFSESS